ncbi:MAG: hypothetical protein KY467_05355 [Gemmatimonadetes bacterium]|nr:hypothetical protein [Gemmatimonadota bacterium]
MKLRFRFLAALLALFGFLTSSVQGAWAATCASNMEMGVSADAASAGPSCSVEAVAFRAPDGHDSDTGGPIAPHCPTMPMGAGGACGAFSAVASDPALPVTTSPVEARLSPHADDVREFLLAGVFFRPPIA